MTEALAPKETGTLTTVPFAHPQGCCSYLIADPVSKQALAIDVHLDRVEEVSERLTAEGWSLPYMVDTHTHADHPGPPSIHPTSGVDPGAPQRVSPSFPFTEPRNTTTQENS